ncbi:cytochrome P450 [Apiospora marii]|uniref:cytochrome P450 n=1 Tax=Apiospora marii TaxID=335849 RepID=UPI00312E7B72
MVSLAVGSAAIGILSHVALYIRGEWHLRAPLLVKLYTILALIGVSAGVYLGHGPSSSLRLNGIIAAGYSLGLFSSIVIYRKIFHRLRHFPGPWLAGATKFWHAWHCRTGRNHLMIEKLRAQYGPFIRTGPRELTIVVPSVPLAVDGPGNKCTKPDWYDLLSPDKAVNTTRSLADHARRRRVWDQGFSPKALAVYEGRVAAYAEKLAASIEGFAARGRRSMCRIGFTGLPLTSWVGEFAFARSFGMLVDEKWHFGPRTIRAAMRLLGTFSAVPWLLLSAFSTLPWLSLVRDWMALKRWCRDRMRERIEMKGVLPDVSHWLIDASVKNGSLEADSEWLNGDAIAIIIAGSDTVAATLVFAFYELAHDPSHQDKLLAELAGVNIHDRVSLQSCQHLNAVINETLRLRPAVPTGGYRETPPESMVIGGTYIPGDVVIVAPRYSISRLEGAYVDSHRWVPERWTTRPEMVRDARGFAPFARGKFNCVGQNLALIELRFVIALLVRKFCFGLPPGESEETLFTDLRDQFTTAPGNLQLQFQPRDPSHGNKIT